jgi:hypothetical protein
MNNNCCCIVFITHKSSLDGYELKSFQQCLDVFGKKRDIKLVIPDNISTEFYDKYSDKFEYCKVNYEWLSSYKAYNKTCCTKEFYELFKDYEYILKYEADAWVFEDRLDEFIKLGYDYYGAPWPQYGYTVGNSGLTLRKVKKIIEIVEKYSNNTCINEDWWFCHMHGNEINICGWEIAANFSLETISDKLLISINGKPMGFHGKHLIDLWDEDGTKFIAFKNNYIKTTSK